MTPLRIAFDMDGTLADLSSAYVDVEDRLFGVANAEHEQPAPEEREIEQHEEDADGALSPGGPTRAETGFKASRLGVPPRTCLAHD